MASDSFKKFPLSIFVLVIAALVLSAVISFYLGRMDGAKQSQTPTPQASGATGSPRNDGLVRLPPQRFEYWTLVCAQNAAKVTRCNLGLTAVSKVNKKPILNLAVTRGGRGRALMLIVTPPGALLSAGVHLTPGTGKEMIAQFIRCIGGACEAALAFDDTAAAEFTAAASTTVSYVAGNGKPVSLKIPNGGFAAGYAAWLSAMPAPAATSPAAPVTHPAPANAPDNTAGSGTTPAP